MNKSGITKIAVSSVAPSVCQRNTLPIDIASVRDLSQLYRSFVYKSEEYSPVARDTKREKTDERRGKTLRMQKGVVRIFAQALNEGRELALLQLWKSTGTSLKLGVEYYLKHFACFGAQPETSLRPRSALSGRDWRRAAPGARIPDGIRPRGLSRQCLSQMSEASAPLFPEKSCSYPNSIRTRRKINEEVIAEGAAPSAGAATSDSTATTTTP